VAFYALAPDLFHGNVWTALVVLPAMLGFILLALVMTLISAGLRALDRVSPSVVAWWSGALALNALCVTPVISGGLVVALLGLLGVVFFGGRTPESRLTADPSFVALRQATAWAPEPDHPLQPRWQWRVALGHAPWWIVQLLLVLAFVFVIAAATAASAAPGAGAGALAGLPLILGVAAFATMSLASVGVLFGALFTLTLAFVGRHVVERVAVPRGEAPIQAYTEAWMGAGMFDVLVLVLAGLPLAVVFAGAPLAALIVALVGWTLLIPISVMRQFQAGLAATATDGRPRLAGFPLIGGHPFAVARLIALQLIATGAVTLLALPLFAVAAVLLSPLGLVGAGVHVLLSLGPATPLVHALTSVVEAIGFLLACAVLVDRVLAPFWLWNVRGRVAFAELVAGTTSNRS